MPPVRLRLCSHRPHPQQARLSSWRWCRRHLPSPLTCDLRPPRCPSPVSSGACFSPVCRPLLRPGRRRRHQLLPLLRHPRLHLRHYPPLPPQASSSAHRPTGRARAASGSTMSVECVRTRRARAASAATAATTGGFDGHHGRETRARRLATALHASAMPPAPETVALAPQQPPPPPARRPRRRCRRTRHTRPADLPKPDLTATAALAVTASNAAAPLHALRRRVPPRRATRTRTPSRSTRLTPRTHATSRRARRAAPA